MFSHRQRTGEENYDVEEEADVVNDEVTDREGRRQRRRRVRQNVEEACQGCLLYTSPSPRD